LCDFRFPTVYVDIILTDELIVEEGFFDWKNQICCPHCSSAINQVSTAYIHCSNNLCEYHRAGFPVVQGQPVLIDFGSSVFTRRVYETTTGSVLRRDVSGRSISSRIHRLTFGRNPVAAQNCLTFLSAIKTISKRPTVLVIGGATIGSGAELLYGNSSIQLVGTDVFPSKQTVLVVDAHKIPFADATFDAVWIQAVLEHVLEPVAVVAEIHRVLRPLGIVYAETPFMQQVHERAYDFTRFTQSGHRWLFRKFTEICAGPVSGPGVALLWSIRYFFRSLGVGDKLSRLLTLPFLWLRFFDSISWGPAKADAASGLYFLGQRSDQSITPADMPNYYNDQR
jgi:SAM-dependent methyltransferase